MMGWVKRRRNGRMRAMPRTLETVLSDSNLERKAMLPVSLRSFAAFHFSRTGSYVSWRKKRPESWISASQMEVAKKAQRHEICSAM